MVDAQPAADLEEIRAQAAALLEPPVIYLPIRHHSPACALVVRAVIEQHRPRAVLVEGPPAFDDHIELLLDPAARMPLAIYAHASYAANRVINEDGSASDVAAAIGPDADAGADEPIRSGSYFPLCDYSPELVALQAGRAVGAELGFVDLDHQHRARYGESPAGHADDRKYQFSDVLRQTASELGCRDHNELWDHLAEGKTASTAEFVTAVLTYGMLARRGTTDEAMAADGTLAREAAMAAGIVAALNHTSNRPNDPIVVVTGAFHTVVLPQLVENLLAGSGPTDVPPSAGPAAGPGGVGELLDHGHGLIRYSFDRLDALAGYAAGMPNPKWYQAVWEHSSTAGQPEPAAQTEPATLTITDTAATLRAEGKDGQPSLPTVVDAMVGAEQLRRLRGRASVTRNDVIDAMVSCFTKGEDSPRNAVRLAAARTMTGFEIGAVPPQTPRVPLAKDFDRLAAAYGIPTDTSEPKQLNLDVYRNERDRKRSRFLHGLTAIGVHFGNCTTPLRFSRATGRDVTRERWMVQLDGATDASLTEASLWGASIAEAVTAKTSAELDDLLAHQPSSAQLMRLVMKAAQRGVPSVVTNGLDAVRQRVAVDPSLAEVVVALSEAELLWGAREPLGGSELEELPELALQLMLRACQLGARLHEAPEEQRRELVQGLETLHRILTTDAWPELDHQIFWDMLADQRHRAPPGMLRGAVGGLEWRGGKIEDSAVLSLVMGHLDEGSDGGVGAAFLEGLILVARDALWEVDGVVEVLSRVIGGYDKRQFLQRVPGFRAAFAALTPRQTDRLAEAVAAVTGGTVPVKVTDIRGIGEADVLRHSGLSAAAVEQLQNDGLGDWLAPTAPTSP